MQEVAQLSQFDEELYKVSYHGDIYSYHGVALSRVLFDRYLSQLP